MDKSVNTAWAAVLPMLLCWNACDVYNPSLARTDGSRRASDAGASIDAAGSNASDDGGDDSESPGEHCGNGLIDPGERCDIAIARGRAGACPEGCSGREACLERELVGHACSVRCIDVEITETISGDGCCPADAGAGRDDDCTGECGNGVVERGERCDPPSSCAQREACASDDVCETAQYLGDPAQCTARCELQPIQACLSGDRCCPPGCTHDSDDDCEPADDAGVPCTENCEPTNEPAPAEPEPASDCQMKHRGGNCETCDCEMCQTATLECLTAPGEGEAAKCEAVIRCAAEANCTNLECLCGPASPQRCPSWPLGQCVSEIRAAGGARDVYQLIATATLLADSTLGRAVAVMTCRQQACRRSCGL